MLMNHVIKTDFVTHQGMCEISCYLEPNCVSYNYGQLNDGLFLCELSDTNHLQASPNELAARDGFIYRPVVMVSKMHKD